MIKLRRLFKYLLIGALGLLISVSQSFVISGFAVTPEMQQSQAQFLISKGNEQLDLGQATEALDSFKKATIIYQKLKSQEDIIGSLINQNIALQALGMYPRACKTLLEAINSVTQSWICEPQQPNDSINNRFDIVERLNSQPIYLLALHNLGDVLRQLGKLSESKIVLQKILESAQQSPIFDNNNVLLSLGITEQAYYNQLRNKYSEIEEPDFQDKLSDFLIDSALSSLKIFQQINVNKTASISLKLQSQLNSVKLLIDFSQWLKVAVKSKNQRLVETQTQIQPQLQSLIKLIIQNIALFNELPANQSIHFQINFANSLAQISDEQLHTTAIEVAQSAFELAKHINHQRMQSYSLGVLGRLEPKKAEYLWLQALSIAQSIQDLELAYQWQKELGIFYNNYKQYEKALHFYEATIKSYQRIRDELGTINADLQFSLQETVEPIYRNYMRLLLNGQFPNLRLIQQTDDQLQLTQLENFLQCRKLDLISLDKVKISSNTTLIKIINLNDLVLIIVQSPNHSLHHYVTSSKLVQSHVNNLLLSLQDERLAAIEKDIIISESQALYQLLFAPIKKYLPSSGTLVFSLDTSFQSIPLVLLHDGQDYLIKHYSMAVTLGSKIRPLKALSNQELKALIAGLSKVSPSFYAPNAPEGLQALLEVEQEVAEINQKTKSSTKLLNEKFTSKRLQQELTTANFPIVHLTTHGQFSSDPQRTVLLAWDKPIDIQQFNGWLKTQQNQDPIELLVLSACQTAKGNKRAALGIAGVAAQAGARSTVATLWQVDAVSTVQLMRVFYQSLKNGIPKAEALRLAQLSLLNDPKYNHPYFWSGFILVGGWL
ncbi:MULTISPECIES: CHAT domain-containing protein [Nostocales]|uniref:CHAT domain-containing protein n=1 Tax=Nostocales TaxID=1161 RepID=UPI0018EF6BC1|nr:MULTISPECIES: CHAT domain-containing protein [Nostocales]